MTIRESNGPPLSPRDGWQTIHETVDRTVNTMYVAGMATILLLWAMIASLGFMTEFLVHELAPAFAASQPWFPGPVWGGLAALGMAGSAIIGQKAGSQMATGELSRSAGIRVFLFWTAVVTSAFLIPGAAGNWSEAAEGTEIQRITVGVIVLGHILFGIMYRPVIVAFGLAFAAAYFIPSYLVTDIAPLITAVAMLAVVGLASIWMRRRGVM